MDGNNEDPSEKKKMKTMILHSPLQRWCSSNKCHSSYPVSNSGIYSIVSKASFRNETNSPARWESLVITAFVNQEGSVTLLIL